MIELRWYHDPTGKEVTKLQWREAYSLQPKWQDVPHLYPSIEQHVKESTLEVSPPLAKE